MTKDDQTIILDYKFGEKEDPAHKTQVLQYVDLLEKNGISACGRISLVCDDGKDCECE